MKIINANNKVTPCLQKKEQRKYGKYGNVHGICSICWTIGLSEYAKYYHYTLPLQSLQSIFLNNKSSIGAE